MKTLWQYLKPYKKQITIGPVFKLAEAILELMIPTMMGMVIDQGVAKGDMNYVFRTGGLTLLLALVGLGCAYVCQYVASIASQGFGTNVRNALFHHISTLSHAQLDTIGAATMVNRITNDVNLMQQGIAMVIRLLIRAPFICIGSFIMAFIIDPGLSLVILAAMPLVVLIVYLVMSRTIPLNRAVQKKLDKIAGILRENLSGVRVIRAFARRGSEEAKFESANDAYRKDAIRVGRLSALLNPATVLIMNAAVIGILYFGGVRVNAGGMRQGEIISFIQYAAYMMQALVVLANLIVLLTKALASGGRVAELLQMENNLPDGAVTEGDMGKAIVEFRDVSFSYHKSEEPTLEHLSFTLDRGETLGVIGGTGAGKSTLIHLIPRFYEATGGEVLVDGVNVKEYKKDALRAKIGIAMQKAVLFRGTMAENIRQGKKGASMEEVRAAARTAQAEEFIEALPKGYDTVVERGGTNFSGGQKQRVSVARALIRRPELLILDDSSSALDYATDAKLRHGLKDYAKDMSVIIVSQRLSAVLDADHILVLKEGVQVGYGTHEELLETNAFYKEICESQLTGEGETA